MIVYEFIIGRVGNIIDMRKKCLVGRRMGMFLNNFRGVERKGLKWIDGYQNGLVRSYPSIDLIL